MGKRYSAVIVVVLALLGSLVRGAAPGWTAATGLANSMNVSAIVKDLDDNAIETAGSQLAAFKDGVCRGVATVTDGITGKFYSMQVFSDAATEAGLELRVYDAGTDTVSKLTETLDFVANGSVGSLFNPTTYHVAPQVANSTAVRTITHSGLANPMVFITVTPATGTATWAVVESIPVALAVTNVTGPNGSYDTTTHEVTWSGTGDTVANLGYTLGGPDGNYTLAGEATYDGNTQVVAGPTQLAIANPPPPSGASREVLGDNTETPIVRVLMAPTAGAAAWTLTEQVPGGLTVANVIGPNGAWNQGNGTVTWSGTGDTAVYCSYDLGGPAGNYTLAGTATVDGGDVAITGTTAVTVSGPTGSGWSAPPTGAESMLIFARVEDDSGNPIETSGSQLAAFNQGAIRGLADLTEGDNPFYAMSVFAQDGDTGAYDLRVYNAGTDSVQNITETFTFVANTQLGTALAPVTYHTGEPPPASTVVRSVTDDGTTQPTVGLVVTPGTGTTSWTVVESIPTGLTVSDITGPSGSWDAANRRLSWFGNSAAAANLSYAVSGADDTYILSGVGTFNGENVIVSGTTTVTITSPPPVSTATRAVADDGSPTPDVAIAVVPADGTAAWSLVETIPAGLNVTNITGPNGAWNGGNRTISWSADSATIATLGYTLDGAADTYTLAGAGTFDGNPVTVGGATAVTVVAPTGPGWESPSGMDQSMLVFATVKDLTDTVIATATNSQLAAFRLVGGIEQVAGVGTVTDNGSGLFGIQVFGTRSGETGLRLKVWDAATETIHPVNYTFTFTNNAQLGTFVTPLDLQIWPDAPVIANLAATNVNEGQATTLSMNLSDSAYGTVNLRVDWGDATAIQTVGNVPVGPYSTQHTYADDDGGQGFTITVTAFDPDTNQATETTAVTVGNVAPTGLALSPLTGTEDVAYTGILTAVDVAGDPLTWSKTGGPAWIQVASTGAVTGTPGNDDTGNQQFSVSVNDGDGGTAPASFTIVVTPVNDPPTVSGLTVPTVDEGAASTLSATLADVDDTSLTVTVDWGDGGAPEDFTNVPLGAFSKTHTYADSGSYTVSVDVGDGEATTPAQTTATVANVAPTDLALSPLTGRAGSAYSGTLTATDIPADPLTWSKTGGPAWIQVAANGAVTGTPTNDDTGGQQVTVAVNDGDGGTTSASFSIIVRVFLEPTVVNGYNFLGVPVRDSGLNTAADVLAWAPNATAVYAWDTARQSWIVHSADSGADFAVSPGMAFFVAADGAGSATMTGFWSMASATPLPVGYNLACLPKDAAVLTTASALLTAFGGDCQGLWAWDVDNQQWQAWLAGLGGTDFSLRAGMPLLLAIGTPAPWPTVD